MPETSLHHSAHAAARAIRAADALFIGAGAGMGVDSGLPDFRGNEGFWKAYPPLQKMGLSFVDIANPGWFESDPHLAWGFYGHRMNLYRATTPHAGFGLLQRFCQGKSHFVFTSNVDGHFQKSGFNSLSVEECHGSLNHFQCADRKCSRYTRLIWSAENEEVVVDETTFLAQDPLPTCPTCGSLARPNVLMFGDRIWLEERTAEQAGRCYQWQKKVTGKFVAIELGAGTAIPSVRRECERQVEDFGGTLIRINVREAQGPEGAISLATGALAGLSMIEGLLED
jgi:NAD-dependent SIR2 family protein deacetylase